MFLRGDWLRVCSPIELNYDTMIFTVSLHGEMVKIHALTTTVEGKQQNGTILTSITHEEILDIDVIL